MIYFLEKDECCDGLHESYFCRTIEDAIKIIQKEYNSHIVDSDKLDLSTIKDRLMRNQDVDKRSYYYDIHSAVYTLTPIDYLEFVEN